MPRAFRPSPVTIPADVAALAAPQLDLFPVRPQVEALDPRSIVGARTGVRAVIRVRFAPTAPPHLVFHDRHGWYCEEHGPGCPAVAAARADRDAPNAEPRA